MSNRIVYLTGSTGFLGGMIVRKLQEDETVAKVYCPIRDKKGMTGEDRLKASVGDFPKCAYLPIAGKVPDDTTHVILNAYNTRFDEDLGDKLRDNVVPIIRIMDELNARKKPIQGITFVSTAYVLPPLPFTSPKGGKLPFLLDSGTKLTATDVYEEALKSKPCDLSKMIPDLHPYYKENSYVFSKHILERLLIEKYPKLPICVVRPSMILPGQDLEYGFTTKSAIPLIFQLAPYPVFLAPRCEGKVNIVFIEDVTKDCMEGAFELAKPAEADESGTKWHTITQSVGHSNASSMMLFRGVAPEVPRFDIRTEWLRNMVRAWENILVQFLFGQRKAKLLSTAYETYDYFSKCWKLRENRRASNLMATFCYEKVRFLPCISLRCSSSPLLPVAHSWGFEPKYSPDVWKVAVDGGWQYHCARRRQNGRLWDVYFWFYSIGFLLLGVILGRFIK